MNQILPRDRQHIDDLTEILKSAHYRTVRLVSVLDSARVPDLAHDLARDHNHALILHLRRARARDLAPARDLARGLARGLDLALDLAPDLARGPNRNVAQARSRAHELVTVLRDAVEEAERLSPPAHQEPRPGDPAANATAPERLPARPVRAAGRIAGLAARVLPVAHRKRYCDEYRSELYELTVAGASWWQQVAHAIRLLNLSWELRHELRRPAARRS